ncbi:hemerythrin domain-containing protein [Moraxella bovis]|uniref:Uncharacterized conserved protein n=1 Tax=Moraxella bovis TaxID=476 RepID=A0A378PRM2_MORBO|nr:hemerythrin domain-containing protein [Moraxella bovis]STY90779.1 Uncharacterized conserved protein [Moraxella bovis]
MSQSDIFSTLIHHHDIQRKLCQDFQHAIIQQDRPKAESAFIPLKNELEAHAAAEERHLYVPVMAFDDGLELSRHAIAEHHEMDEMMAVLSDGRTGDERFFKTAQELIDETLHHLKEEENEFFKEARELLDKPTQERLGKLYQAEHQAFEDKHGE